MKIYKIGIIGCGGIAQKMAATLEKMKGVERYAVASRNQEKAEAFANNGDSLKHMVPTKNWQAILKST